MKKEQFQGYILEYGIAKLISGNGFTLIQDDTLPDIEIRGNNLNLIGRGAPHQFDVLGQFKWHSPFIYPIRLFVEAKFRKKKVGIELVRAGVGILADVNQNYSTVNLNLSDIDINLPRYDYHYSIFSTSGFSLPAITMALAHKINLVDLRDASYKPLLDAIGQFTDIVFYLHQNNRNQITAELATRYKNLVYNTFLNINTTFEDNEEDDELISYTLQNISNSISGIGTIYLATTSTPFIIALCPNNNRRFKESMRRNPNQRIGITWQELESEWLITSDNEEFTLSFRLPESIKEYIFSEDRLTLQENAIRSKFNMFDKFSFYIDYDDNIQLCSLAFSSETTQRILERDNRIN
ncbi:hypothetical protein HIU97_12070 [Enterococcus casseliflavus]|uniref:hypothetical protein n=1 Tax=Enterococcus casseliflavus TaxID=37734 RepID=UPI001C44C923|nr:hypothetical protein [Enterococcus casseliflavus]MBV6375460.1 hypothetical protein [Enterococcus casseliflavus]